MQYHFEEIQPVKFVVYDADDKKHLDNPQKQEVIGEMECTLADIVAAGQKYQRKLRLKGTRVGSPYWL